MNKMKEKRNAEVKAMEDEVHIILSSKTGISIEDICDKVDLLHKKKLRFDNSHTKNRFNYP
jgi:ABC-type polysaccharide/polyol phosphate transport system ATPase subunit